MGVVYHANYAVWFELARTDWVRAQGMPYSEAEKRGLLLPVVDLSVSFRQPARYDDLVEVRCRVVEFSPVRIAFEYEARLAEQPDVVLAAGSTRHVWVGRDWKPVRLDRAAPDLYAALAAVAAASNHR